VRSFLDVFPHASLWTTEFHYATWVRPKEFARVLPRLLAPRTDPPLRGTDEAFLAALADERNRLFRFYGAGLYAYNGERELSAREMNRVMREDGRNPYYRWFVGRGR
jgi:spermidine synthase